MKTKTRVLFAIALFLGLTLLPGGAKAALYGETSTGVDVNVNVGEESKAEASGNVDASAETKSETTSEKNTVSATTETSGSADVSPIVLIRANILGDTKAEATSPATVETKADLSAHATAVVKADENIKDVEIGDDKVMVSYKQRAKLFGFIPVSVFTTAEVAADGSVTLDYPWYNFLLVTNETELKSELEAKAKTTLATQMNVTASAEADAKLSTHAKAALFDEVRATMKSNLDAAISAEATSDTKASVN